MQRIGRSSHTVVHKPGEIWDVHRDVLKPYVKDETLGTNAPLYTYKGTTKSSVLGDTEDMVKSIKQHRFRNGKLEFLVKWKDQSESENSWEPATTFVQPFSKVWLDYLTKENLEANLQALF